MISSAWLNEPGLNLSPAQISTLLAASEDPRDLLARRGWATRDQILMAISNHLGVASVDLMGYEPASEALDLVPERIARQKKVLPLFLLDEQLFLAVEDPMDLPVQDFISLLTGRLVQPVLADPQSLTFAINRLYLTQVRANQAIRDIMARGTAPQISAAPAGPSVLEDRDAPAVRVAETILTQAVHLKASDIHLEPATALQPPRLRYRIDGVLHGFPPPPEDLYPSVVSRLKVLSGLDIAERRAPQDGRLTAEVDGQRHDMRVSVLPQKSGEGVVLRLFNSGWAAQLEDLGMPDPVSHRLEEQIRRPTGLVLVTGPTGSGKTTTLYAILRRLSSSERKFITVEDPVEQILPEVNQVEINPEANLSFGDGLRSILRHDPDVIMVGEVRDAESAEISLRSAMTGHLVLSTVHTNNAPLALTRLVDLGIPAYLVMAALNGVLAQRLIRRLCPHCKRVRTDRPDVPLPLPDGPLYTAVGCEQCYQIGYSGRIGIFEFLRINPTMRRLRGEDLTAERILDTAGPSDYWSFIDSARELLVRGDTSVEEVLTVMTAAEVLHSA